MLQYIFPIFGIICLCRNYSSTKEIKYDQRDKGTWLIIAVSISVVYIPALIWYLLACYDVITTGENTWTYVLIGINVFMPQFFVVVWLQFLECILYHKRLIKHGYEVPKDKYDYRKSLELLPKVNSELVAHRGISNESIVLAILCWSSILINIILCVWFWQKYVYFYVYGMLCMIPFGLVILMWFLAGRFCWKQRNYNEYRDDTEVDEQRKQRLHVITGGFAFAFLWCANAMIIYIMSLNA